MPTPVVSWLSPEVLDRMDQCLDSAPTETERYEWMKATPGKFGMRSMMGEVKRFEVIDEFGIAVDLHLRDVPAEPRWGVLDLPDLADSILGHYSDATPQTDDAWPRVQS